MTTGRVSAVLDGREKSFLNALSLDSPLAVRSGEMLKVVAWWSCENRR